MALTEEERRLLAELEETFSSEDPKLATKLSQPATRHVHPTKAVLGVLGLIIGLLALVMGISVHWGISVGGFVVMLCSTIVLLSAWAPAPTDKPSQQAKPPSDDFMSRMESRWQNRQRG